MTYQEAFFFFNKQINYSKSLWLVTSRLDKDDDVWGTDKIYVNLNGGWLVFNALTGLNSKKQLHPLINIEL